MAVKTTLAQLEEVQAAISKVMAGQSAEHGGTTVTMASLATLSKREADLLARYNAETGSTLGPAIIVNTPGREC